MFFMQTFPYINLFNFLTPCLKLDMSNKQDDDDDEKTDEVQQHVCVKCD